MYEDSTDSFYSESSDYGPGRWWCGSTRVTVALMCMLGYMTLTCQRSALEVTMVCMLNVSAKTALDSRDNNAVSYELSQKGQFEPEVNVTTFCNTTMTDDCLTTEANNVDLDMIESSTMLTETVTEAANLDSCPVFDVMKNQSAIVGRYGKLKFDQKTQSMILGAFYWGYAPSVFLGGWLATHQGGRRVVLWGVFALSLCTLATHLAAVYNSTLLIMLRFCAGIFAGGIVPGMFTLLSRWSAPCERTWMLAVMYLGGECAWAIRVPLSGVLCGTPFISGWPLVFYILGLMGLLWLVLWSNMTADWPEDHKYISLTETEYLSDSLQGQLPMHDAWSMSIPWCGIVQTLPMWSVTVAVLTLNWLQLVLFQAVPVFLQEVMHFNIGQNSFFSSLPGMIRLPWLLVPAIVADQVKGHNLLSGTAIRKIMHSLGTLVPAALLVGLGFMDCSTWPIALALLMLALCCHGISISGCIANLMELGPQYVGLMYGMSHGVAGVLDCVVPYVLQVVQEQHTVLAWQILFYSTAGIVVLGTAFYCATASADIQHWALVACIPLDLGDDAHPRQSGKNSWGAVSYPSEGLTDQESPEPEPRVSCNQRRRRSVRLLEPTIELHPEQLHLLAFEGGDALPPRVADQALDRLALPLDPSPTPSKEVRFYLEEPEEVETAASRKQRGYRRYQFEDDRASLVIEV